MGLLDDAIREHLDLKRRRGADPGEVERAEREALGPVRRGPEGTEEPDAGGAEDVGSEEFSEPLHEPDPEWEEATRSEGIVFEDELDDPAYEDAVAEPAEEPLRSRDRPEEPDEAHRPAGELPASRPGPRPEAPSAEPLVSGDDTVEYELEPVEGERGAERGEDMLEETPEFLQDTPDHDRLWFEQRPPKDFDFDE